MKRIFDNYVENVLDLVPLDLPDEDVIAEKDIADIIEAVSQSITIQVNVPKSRFGRGRVAVAIHPGHRKVLYMGASANMFNRGLKKSAIIDSELKMYSKCWDKPTTAGIIGCVFEKLVKWLFHEK